MAAKKQMGDALRVYETIAKRLHKRCVAAVKARPNSSVPQMKITVEGIDAPETGNRQTASAVLSEFIMPWSKLRQEFRTSYVNMVAQVLMAAYDEGLDLQQRAFAPERPTKKATKKATKK